MNAVDSQPKAWTRGRWFAAIAVVFAAHIGFICAFSAPRNEPRRPDAGALEFSLLLDTGDNSRWLQATEIQDPTTLALAHPRGFSGKAWDASAKSGVEPLRWVDSPDFLAPAYETFGLAFSDAAAPRTDPDDFSSQRRVPPIRSGWSTVTRGIAVETRLALPSSLRRRGLRSLPPPPLLAAGQSLPDTVIEIEIGRDGAVFTARVSGLGRREPGGEFRLQAERQALRHARTLRFQPLPAAADPQKLNDAALTAGRLVYQWGYARPPQPAKDSSR